MLVQTEHIPAHQHFEVQRNAGIEPDAVYMLRFNSEASFSTANLRRRDLSKIFRFCVHIFYLAALTNCGSFCAGNAAKSLSISESITVIQGLRSQHRPSQFRLLRMHPVSANRSPCFLTVG
jgi:hypothetical protein